MDGKKSIFIFITHSGISAMQIKQCNGLVALEHVTMFKSTPTLLLIHTFQLYTTCENGPVSSKPLRNNFEILKKATEVWDNSRYET